MAVENNQLAGVMAKRQLVMRRKWRLAKWRGVSK
jgi:hypothetical protein